MSRSAVFLVSLCLAVTGQARAGAFVPADLHAYEVVTFANGFRAVLNPRPVSRNVAFRLVVDVGLLDVDCADRELPHLVEHLMFSGVDDLDESALDALVGSLGGYWNAYTHAWRTEYQLDIFSGHTLEGLDILYRILTATQFSSERVANAQAVVQAESGGEAGRARQLLFGIGFGEGAVDASYRRFVPESRAFCARVPTVAHLDLVRAEAFRREHYRPNTMLLFAVGDFDRATLVDALATGFGGLPHAPRAPLERPPAPSRVHPEHFRTTLAPVFGNTTHVAIDLMVGAPAPLTPEAFALQELAGFLDARLYEELRVVRGLAYTPSAALVDHGDFSTLLLEAEVDPVHADDALEVMTAMVDEVGRAGIDAATLAAQRRGTLYSLAAHLDTNASFADIYANASAYFRDGGVLPDIETAIATHDADGLRTVAGRLLRSDAALVYIAAPTFTYGTLGWLAAGSIVLVGWSIRGLGRRRFRRA